MADTADRVRGLTAHIISAYVENNSVRAAELPALIEQVSATLTQVESGQIQAPEPERPVPHVPIKKTVTPEYLISLEDGKRYKTLKRHLSRMGMTPAEYREKWGLPSDYPMVAASYAAKRSELARRLGLGRKAGEKAPARQTRKKRA